MWLSKAASLAAVLLALAGCGFTPVYATPDTGTAIAMQDQLRNVEIGLIADRDGQYLRNAIIDQVGAPAGPQRYFLRIYKLKTEDIGFGLRKNASHTRGDLVVTADMQLIDTNTGAPVLTRALRARGGYNRMDNLYGALVSKEDMSERLLKEMATQAVTEMTLFFSREGG